ncbi:MAG: septum formation initiator family protein [Clostridia bacterium]|nr:septum formation initiator family protein [Clostridia bacterium]MDR3645007.1 septum formation initiator family protein [Clostridia bacterium]
MKKHRKNILLRVAVCAFIVYLGVTLVTLQIQINQKKTQLGQIKVSAVSQEAQNEQLQRVLNAQDQNQYIADIARGSLNYAKPHENVFIDAGN